MPARHRHHRFSSAAVIAAAATLSLASSASPAATRTWTNPAGGSWSDPGNWSPSPPASSDTAVFDLNSAPAGYTVTLPSSVSTTGTLAVGNDTLTLAVPAGGAPDFDTLTLAGTSAQTASATVTGGALNLNYAALAPAGSATLTVSPNSTLLTRFTFSSGSAGGSATVNVGGAGARLAAGQFQLGTAGPSTLDVTAGGVVTGNTTAINTFLSGDASFAGASGGSATVTVDGPGSLLSYSTLQLAAPSAPVPAPPSASLVVRNGARVAVDYLTAAGNGATASVSLDGPGTTLAASSVTLGYSGASASLSLTNGASLTGGLYVGTSIGGATGSAVVSVSSGSVLNTGGDTVGAGSAVTVSSDTASPSTWTTSSLALSAGATATIGAGGQLTATRLTGNGTLRLAGGVASVANSFGFRGTLAGSGSASGFNILPSFTFAPDGTLDFSYGSPGSHSALSLVPPTRINLDITSPSTYDRLTTPNTVRYDGTLAVSLDPSYTPAAGDAFDLLDVYARNGTSTFATLSLPPLPPGLTWDTSALYTTGTLSITIPEPTSLLAACALTLPLLTRRTKS